MPPSPRNGLQPRHGSTPGLWRTLTRPRPGWDLRRFGAEILGTFLLVFVATGAIVANDFSGGAVTHVGVSLTFGLIVMVMIYTVGPTSGAHMNPAVSLGLAMAGQFPTRELPSYLVAQCIGASLASLGLAWFVPGNEGYGGTVPAIGVPQAFVLEILLTAMLMTVILRVSSSDDGVDVGLAVGATVALAALFAGPLCGASMNPARSLGPAVASGIWEHHWLYWLAPCAGALLASGSWVFLKKP